MSILPIKLKNVLGISKPSSVHSPPVSGHARRVTFASPSHGKPAAPKSALMAQCRPIPNRKSLPARMPEASTASPGTAERTKPLALAGSTPGGQPERLSKGELLNPAVAQAQEAPSKAELKAGMEQELDSFLNDLERNTSPLLEPDIASGSKTAQTTPGPTATAVRRSPKPLPKRPLADNFGLAPRDSRSTIPAEPAHASRPLAEPASAPQTSVTPQEQAGRKPDPAPEAMLQDELDSLFSALDKDQLTPSPFMKADDFLHELTFRA